MRQYSTITLLRFYRGKERARIKFQLRAIKLYQDLNCHFSVDLPIIT